MKKNKKNHLFQLGIILFGISIFLWNCEKDPLSFNNQVLVTEASKYNLKKISFEELTKDREFKYPLEILKNKFVDNQQNIFARSTTQVADGVVILTEQINRIETESIITWTFEVETPALENSDFENFLVKKNGDEFTYFLVSYELNENETELENLYNKVTSYKIAEEYLTLDGLDLASRDAFDWVLDDGSGTNEEPCEGILQWDSSPCEASNSSPHYPACQHFGNPHGTYGCSNLCRGTPILYLDFSHCSNYQPQDNPNGDPVDGSNPNDNQHGGGGTPNDGGADPTVTSPVNLEDPRCPPNSGKIYDPGENMCVCPVGYIEDDEGKCILDDCDTSKEDLKKIFPSASDADLSLLAHVINTKGRDFGINSKEKLQHFLSQAGHETGGLSTLNVTESTYWTTASKLAATYTRFTMDSVLASTNANRYYALDYLRNSSGVANIAMCCQYENGNVASGDGYKYRGRGLFQLTWKENYRRFKEWYNNQYDPDKDFVANPGLVSSNDTLAILSGLWYYKFRVLDKINDLDSTTTVSAVTRKINGRALKGLKDRKARFQKAKDSIKCKN